MEIEKVIGGRVARFREALGLSQAQLGERLGETLARPWTRQSVWAAEAGKRAFTAEELVALAHALSTTVDALFVLPIDVNEINMSSGKVIKRGELVRAVTPYDSARRVFEAMRGSLAVLSQASSERMKHDQTAAEAIEQLYEQLVMAMEWWARERGEAAE